MRNASSAAEERGLLVDVDIAMCQQGYTELFDRRLLEAIHDQTKPRSQQDSGLGQDGDLRT
eukprot:COSAG06_NODE_749_length_12615_cov_35.521333_10_plen_61_part_00